MNAHTLWKNIPCHTSDAPVTCPTLCQSNTTGLSKKSKEKKNIARMWGWCEALHIGIPELVKLFGHPEEMAKDQIMEGINHMAIDIREMTPDNYEDVIDLWKASRGIGLSEADSRDEIAHYLEFNPGLSFVALEDGQLVGAVLCGQDGRRGYLHHLAVSNSHHRKGIGKALVDRCLESLKTTGIHKCHIFVFHANQDAIAFWKNLGWEVRTDIFVMSRRI